MWHIFTEERDGQAWNIFAHLLNFLTKISNLTSFVLAASYKQT